MSDRLRNLPPLAVLVPVAWATLLLASGLVSLAGAPAPAAAPMDSSTHAALPPAPVAQAPPSTGREPTAEDAATYPVTFSQYGLPCCYFWSVTVEGVTLSTNGGSQVVYLPNGTHGFTAAPLIYYLPSPSSGNVTVTGGPTGVTIDYYSPPTYTVQVNESGLPSSAQWTIVVHFGDVSGGQLTYRNTGTPAYLYLRNDHYTFDITGPAGYGVVNGVQAVVVAGDGAYCNVSFHVGAYNLTFQEVGLPSGTSWTVEVGGQYNSSTGSSVVDYLNNGSYPYLVGTVAGFTDTPHLGTALISGYDDLVPIVFAPATFPVSATEVGLPSGISWWVTVNGTRFSSVTAALTFAEPNGTYDYLLGTEGGYYAPGGFSGTFTIAGAGATLSVTWAVTTYLVDFTENGLPAGTTWSVVVGNRTYTAGVAEQSTDLPNGTYSFRYSVVSGYTSSPENGTFTVASNGTYERVQFNATASNAWWAADTVPGVPAWAVIGVVVAIAALATVVLLRSRRRR